MLSKNVFISEDWVFIDDETYFRKVSSIIEEIIQVQTQREFCKKTQQYSDSNLEIFHYTCCESGYWLSEEIYKSISNLKDICLQVTAVVLNDHVSKVFVIVHLMKYNRNHFLNRMKFVFLRYYFDLLYGATDVSAGYISRRILDDIHALIFFSLKGNSKFLICLVIMHRGTSFCHILMSHVIVASVSEPKAPVIYYNLSSTFEDVDLFIN